MVPISLFLKWWRKERKKRDDIFVFPGKICEEGFFFFSCTPFPYLLITKKCFLIKDKEVKRSMACTCHFACGIILNLMKALTVAKAINFGLGTIGRQQQP